LKLLKNVPHFLGVCYNLTVTISLQIYLTKMSTIFV